MPDPGEARPKPALPERSGPLAVERLRKEDGRLLILYSRVDEPAEGAGA